MRKYELMTIFPIEEDLSKAAQESVRSILGEFGAEIEKSDAKEEYPISVAAERGRLVQVPARFRGRWLSRSLPQVQ